MIVFRQVSQSFEEWCAVVCDDFSEGSPSAEDVFKNPVAKCLCGFRSKHSKFRVVHERAACLCNIFIRCGRHVHGVDIRFRKDRCGCCNNWGNKDLSSLSELAYMARTRVPVYVG